MGMGQGLPALLYRESQAIEREAVDLAPLQAVVPGSAPAFAEGVAALQSVPGRFERIDELGVYLHVPFCRQLCSYCPYNKERFAAYAARRYTEAVVREIDRYAGIIGDRYIDISPGGSDELLGDGGRIFETESAINLEELVSKYIFEKD